MGRAKEAQLEQQSLEQLAIEIGIEASVFTRCENCEDVTFDPGAELEPAYRLANRLVTEGDDRVAHFKDKRRALTDAIKAAAANLGEECHCQYMINKAVSRDD